MAGDEVQDLASGARSTADVLYHWPYPYPDTITVSPKPTIRLDCSAGKFVVLLMGKRTDTGIQYLLLMTAFIVQELQIWPKMNIKCSPSLHKK